MKMCFKEWQTGQYVNFEKLVLKQGTIDKKIKMYDYCVHAVEMEAIEYIEVEWQDCDYFVGKFQLKPKVGTFRVKYPISEFGVESCMQTNIKLQHLLMRENHATTG
jgi:hypothetical protein